MERRYDTVRGPGDERQHFHVRVDVQLRYLQGHGRGKDDPDRDHVKVAQGLQKQRTQGDCQTAMRVCTTVTRNRTYLIAPEGVVDAAHEDRQQRQGDAEQVEREQPIVAVCRVARERVVDRGEDHAELKAEQQHAHDHLVGRAGLYLQHCGIVVGKDEKHAQAEYVAPDVDRLVRPPEHALEAEARGQVRPVAGAYERIEPEMFRRFIVRDHLLAPAGRC